MSLGPPYTSCSLVSDGLLLIGKIHTIGWWGDIRPVAPVLMSWNSWISQGFLPPGTPSVLFFLATLPLKPATIALKIGHLAFQAVWFHRVFFFRTFTTRDNFVRAPWIALVLCTRNSLVAGNMARWAPTSYKWSYNLYKQGYDPSCPFIRPFIGVITPSITSSGPTLYPGMVYWPTFI